MNKMESKIFGAYSGSLICRDFSERNEFHGYLLWDIENDNAPEEISIDNNYSFHDIEINQFTDFDDLDVQLENPTEFNRVRLVWGGYSSQFNTKNLTKLKTFINSKYNVITIKNKKNFINELKIDVENNNDLSLEKISTQQGQHKLFKEYLEQLGYDEKVINEITDLDIIINKRLNNVEYENIICKPIRIKGTNFRSYADLSLDFRDLNGIIQITGKNQVGKTTLYSLISYILFGKICETESRQKNGDNRFINNKVTDDFCSGDYVFEANNEYYGVRRRTERKWNRGKTEITSASTTVNYYKLQNPDDEFNEDNIIDNLNDDQKVKTQKLINNIVNDYDNFKRLVLTTSDTLNEILSIDKASFIDNILFNLGMDFFDNKLNELKIYKKELDAGGNRISLNVEQEEKNKISYNESIIKLNEINIVEAGNLKELNKRLNKGNVYKENLIKELFKIDDQLVNLKVDEIIESSKVLNDKIAVKRVTFKTNKQRIKTLPLKFDDRNLVELNKTYQNHKNEISEIKDKISGVKENILQVENKIAVFKTNNYHITKDNIKINAEIEDFEHSKNCPTCKRLLEKVDLIHIKNKIDEQKIKNENNVTAITKNNKSIILLESKITDHEAEIKKLLKGIDDINISSESLVVKISSEENVRKDYNLKLELVNANNSIETEANEIKNKIEKNNQLLVEFEKNKTSIKKNVETNSSIDKASELIIQLNNQVKSSEKIILVNDGEIKYNNEKISDINKNIKKYKVQEWNDEIVKIFEKCVHRNGIPTLLLKKYSLPQINQTLTELLKDVNFNVWLDQDDLVLKMSDIIDSDKVIDCISGSGKERTFSAIALKHALNELNIKSKPSLLILDEVTGKLVDNSVDEFVDMLKILKNKIDTVIVIEHVNDISPDHIIKVDKNEKGISEITDII